ARRLARRRARDPAGQRHRRVDRAPSPQDRRCLPGEAASDGSRSRIRPAAGPRMRIGALRIRARLTLWHAGGVPLLICVFGAGGFLFARARLYSALDDQIRDDLTIIDKVYREETGDLGELALRVGTRFEVTEGATVIYRTTGWPPVGTTPFRLST